MSLLDRLRGPASLVTLTASYMRRASLREIATGARIAVEIGRRVRHAPILRPNRELLARPDDLAPVCTLVSDTHLCVDGSVPVELPLDPGQWPYHELPSAAEIADGLRRILAHIRVHAAHTVLWCGDEVDSGDAAEWASWRSVVESVPGLAHRLVPGNHDICFNRPFDEDSTLARRAVRERAYQEHAGRLADFPIVDTIITDVGPANVVLLDSCRHRSTHVLSNAVGKCGDDQLDELARLLSTMQGPLLVVMHHHPWRDESFLEPDAWYNTAVDADRLTALLGAYRRRGRANQVMVCHGHRHAMTAGNVGHPSGEIAIVGLPSSTLGDKSVTGQLDARLRYGVAGLRRDGSWGLALHDVGPLVQPRKLNQHSPSLPPGPSLRALSALAFVP
ncbi:MAG TPA: metallophosphoesterase [Kofleriaceae bacterium]|jgi:hypothetical protein